MIVGIPPFYNSNKHKMYYMIEHGEIKWPTQEKHQISVSKEAKDLIGQLLRYKPEHRLTAAEALDHKWFKENAAEEGKAEAQTLAALSNLKNFRAEQKLQQAALTFIVS